MCALAAWSAAVPSAHAIAWLPDGAADEIQDQSLIDPEAGLPLAFSFGPRLLPVLVLWSDWQTRLIFAGQSRSFQLLLWEEPGSGWPFVTATGGVAQPPPR